MNTVASLISMHGPPYGSLPRPTLGWALLPHPAGSFVWPVDLLLYAMLGFSVVVVLIVLYMVVGFSVKYRAGADADRSGRLKKTFWYEMTVIIVFTVLGLSIYVWGAKVFVDMKQSPADAKTIYVVGKQWMWKLHHPQGPDEINALHIPVGEPIKLVMSSQDVIHSFFVPAFRAKQDLLPDQYTTLWFQASTPGKYRFQCSQYCGTDHSQMKGWVYAMTPANYQKWLSGQAPPGQGTVPGTPGTSGAPLATHAAAVFRKFGCIACHTRDSDVRAPRLDGLFGHQVKLDNGRTLIADEAYLRESILQPNAKISAGYAAPSLMPTYKGQANEQQIEALIEFIKSIRDGWPDQPHDGSAPGNAPANALTGAKN